jgi:hypothetical protein
VRELQLDSEEDIAAFVKSGKTTDELGSTDTKESIDGCHEVVVPMLSRLLENVNEVFVDLVITAD